MANRSTTTWLTVPQIAELLQLDVHGVLAFIRNGELAAVDVRRPGSKRPPESQRPRWRISSEALDLFLRRRAAGKPVEAPRRRRVRTPEDYIEYV